MSWRRGWALVLLASAPAAAGDLAKREEAVHRKVGASTRRFAKLLAERKEYASAGEELRRFLLLDPEDDRTRQQLLQLVKRGRAEDAGTDISIPRRAARAECTKALLDFAAECERAGDVERLWRAWTAAVIAYEATPPDGAEWFAPYGLWVRKADRVRLEAGDEFVDGKWLDAREVAALDAKHSASKEEWVLEDGVHVVRTAEPLRAARRVLYQAGAFRRFFVSRFAGWWDLRPPNGKLPILFTGTQEEIRKKVAAYDHAGGDVKDLAAAFYLWTNMPLNPCFVTMEPIIASTGKPEKLTFDEIAPVLRHELAHQIAFEYSRHANPSPRETDTPWVVEGLAEFLACYAPGPTGWRLVDENQIFVRFREEVDRMPKLADFIATPKDGYNTVEHYTIGAGVFRFFWEADGGRHRASIVKLAEIVHQSKATPLSFSECFKDNPSSFQPAWDAFARTLGASEAPGGGCEPAVPEDDEGVTEGCG
jgi:hypothetical protein